MPIGVQEFSFHLSDDFFTKMESTDVQSGNVDVGLTVSHIGDIYELYFTLKGVIGIPCDRCLDKMEHFINTTYTMSVKYGYEYTEGDDIIVLPEGETTFNVARTIYDTVALTIPIMHVHEDGKCDEMMSQLLEQHTAHIDDDDDNRSNDPRWDALKKLTDSN